MRVSRSRGFTLIEFVLATLTLVVAATAILGAYVGQVTLNEHARNLSLAIQDASRVIEQIRVRNTSFGGTPCQGQGGTEPTVEPPPVTPPSPPDYATWNAWLAASAGGGGLSLGTQPERLVVTCQDNASGALCGSAGIVPQVSSSELNGALTNHPNTDMHYDPIRVTVAVCWRHRNRTIGQCTWNGTTLTPNDTVPFPNNTTNVIESPAMLTTIVTCRSQ